MTGRNVRYAASQRRPAGALIDCARPAFCLTSCVTAMFTVFATACAISTLAAAADNKPAALHFTAQAWPPFVYLDHGKVAGPFPDIVYAACSALKITCTIEIYPWRRAYQLAADGGADGLLAILSTPERSRVFYMSPPLMRSAYVLYAQQDSALHYTTPTDVAGYTVGVYGPSGTSYAADELVHAATGAQLRIEIDNETALRKLRMGRYGSKAVVVMNEEVGAWMMQREGDAGLKQAGELRKIVYHLGLSRKGVSAETAGRFHAQLAQMVKDGSIKAITDRYGLRGP